MYNKSYFEAARSPKNRSLLSVNEASEGKADAEKALLDCGFSHKQAKTILSKGFKAIQANDDRDDLSTVCDEQKAQIELINSFFNKLKGN